MLEKYYFFPSTPPPSLFPFSPTSHPCVSVYCLPLGLSRYIVSPATSSRTTSVGDASARILLCRQQQALEVHQPALGDGGDGADVQPTSAGGSLGDTSHIPGAVVGARRRTSKYLHKSCRGRRTPTSCNNGLTALVQQVKGVASYACVPFVVEGVCDQVYEVPLGKGYTLIQTEVCATEVCACACCRCCRLLLRRVPTPVPIFGPYTPFPETGVFGGYWPKVR